MHAAPFFQELQNAGEKYYVKSHRQRKEITQRLNSFNRLKTAVKTVF